MKTIFVILAPSRSGKDTLASLLADKMDRKPVQLKWSSHVKRTVEYTYSLPIGSLELPEIRNSIIPGTTQTYLDLLVSFYHNQDKNADPYFWKRPVFRQLEEVMQEGSTIISTDTRDTFEVDAIIDLSTKYKYQVVLVKLDREGNSGLTSDMLLERNFKLLKSYADASLEFTIANDPDNFELKMVPVSVIVYHLAQDMDKDRSETVHF